MSPLEQIGLDNIICIQPRQYRLLNISNCLMPGERYWGSHYTRLKEIKKVFRAHQCIVSLLMLKLYRVSKREMTIK